MLSDRYELEKRLASDPHVTVHLATAVWGDREGERLTLTVLPPTFAEDRHAFAVLEQRFAAVRALDHPNIARLYELHCDEEDGCYFTSELIDGEPLRSVLDHLRPERLDRAEADGIVRAVGAALVHAHSRGVVHGQVRAEHVVVTWDHRCVLTGFLARQLSEPGASSAIAAGADVRALAQLALEVYTGLPMREALQQPERMPAPVLVAIRSVLRARPADGTPSAALFLATAGLAADDWRESPLVLEREEVAEAEEEFFEAPLRTSTRSRAVGGRSADGSGSRTARLVALLSVAAAATVGLLAYYDSTDRSVAQTVAALQRAGSEALRSVTARWAPPPAPHPVEIASPAPETAAPLAAEVQGDERPPPTGATEAEAPPPEMPPEIDRADEPIPPPTAAVERASEPVAPPVVEAPPSLSLDVAAIAVRENHGAVAVDVIRKGDSTARSSVAWWTTPESADPYDDFASFGTAILEFPPGETQRRVLVPIVDDGIREADETFVIHLASRPRGATAGRVMATRVTVHDDD